MRRRLAALVLAVAALCMAADLAPGVRDAAAALQRGEFMIAEAKLRAELKLHPNDSDALSLLGVTLDNQKKFAEADTLHRRALASASQSARVFGNYGNHLLLTGDRRGARDAFQKALAVDRTDRYANLQLAQLALAAKDTRGTLIYLDQLPEAQRDDPDAAVLRLAALDIAGSREDADAMFQRLCAASRGDAALSGSLGWTLAQVGLYDRSEAFLTQALAIEPANFRFLYDMGVVGLYAQQYERARDVLEKAARRQPENVDALYSLAFAYNVLKQPEPALRLLAKATQLAPRRADVVRLIAVTTGELSADEDAAAAWERYLELVPTDDAARRERGFARTHIRQFESGIADLEWYIKRHPDDPVGYYQLGLAQSTSDPTKGIESLNKALVLKPNLTAARAARGALHYVQGNPEAAIPDLEAAAAGEPANGLILDRLGQAYRALDRLRDAIRALRRAAELAPTESTVVLHLASALGEAGQEAESDVLMGRYRQMRPPQAPKDLMRYLSLTPEQQRADYRARVEKAVKEHPEDPIAQAQYLKLSLEEGQIEHAATAARAIADLKASAAVMADAGRALLEARQYASAKELLEKAAKADPSAGLELDLATAVFRTSGPADGLRDLERVPEGRRGAWYHVARAQMLDAAGKTDDAIAAIDRAIEGSPKNADLYWHAVVLLSHNQRDADALELLSKAEQKMPQEPTLHVMHATLLDGSGKTEEAMTTLDAVQRRWPELAAAWVARGTIEAAHAQYADAKRALETAISLGARSPETIALASKLTDTPDPRRLFQTRPPREW